MSLVQYTISNNSAVAKTFLYYSSSTAYNITVQGFTSSIFLGEDIPPPTLLITGSMISEDTFISDAYIPPSGSAYLWNNGDKVQYIKISNTPLTGSNISSTINSAEWIEFSMVGAKDKTGNFIYPTAPNSAIVERYIIANANDQGTYNSIIINDSSTETSNAVTANSSSTDTGFSYIDQQFSIDSDCDPLLNNATEPRTNEWLQDVDYSVNAIIPINFDQLINFTATKAAVPQSNYTQLGFVHSRYVGSSTTRDKINEYNPNGKSDSLNKVVFDNQSPDLIDKGKGPSLGKIPNVELNNAYIAYFNKVIDPYPILNNKVAYYTKYLIDEGGNILDPSVSNINFSILQDTFQLKDYDNLPTRVNTAVSNIDQGKELLKLNEGVSPVFRVGEYPFPILYTQTSSIGYASEISLSGSLFYTALGDINKNFIKLGIDIFSTQSDAPVATSAETPVDLSSLNELDWLPINITPFEINTPPTISTSSFFPTYAIVFPTNDNNTPITPGAGNPLSDNYVIRGSFTFTTSTMPAKYTGGDAENLDSSVKWYKDRQKVNDQNLMTVTLSPYVKPPSSAGSNKSDYVNTTKGFKVKKDGVKLVITVNPGGINPVVYPPLVIEEEPKVVSTKQWELTKTGLNLTPDSLYLEELIISNLLGRNPNNSQDRINALPLIAGGWFTSGGGVNFGWGGLPVRYDWTVEFEFDDVVQGTGFFLECNGSLDTQDDAGKNTRPRDVFIFIGENGSRRSDLKWKRTFTPTFANLPLPRPILKYSITSPLSENAVRNQASGPFWRRYPDPLNPTTLTTDVLYMSSSILNQTYGKSFIQANLPYVGAVSTDFPLTVEPDFIEFDPVTDYWELQPGDEIRFENSENYVYTITATEGRDAITKPSNINSELPKDKLRVVIAPPFEYTGSNGEIIVNRPSNFDFFVVRRYKENKNFIILNQQMPYGVISTGKGEVAFSAEDGFVGVEPVSPSSSPGILLPEHRIEIFNKNPDLVLKDLIEKRII
jgi:hypothetical protein